MPLRELYRQALQKDGFSEDAAQLAAIAALSRVGKQLTVAASPPIFTRLLVGMGVARRPATPKGVYLWGGVGRGKTFLMDLFHDSLPFEAKLRSHFHRFMNDVHQQLKSIEDQNDPLNHVAERLATRYRLICFDEFFVSDIADAMILGTLFTELFRRGVCLVATSNVPPRELYKEGLQRARFLPAIEQLQAHTEVIHVDGPIDYRLRVLEKADVYQNPLGHAANLKLAEYFDAIAPDAGRGESDIEVLGRSIKARSEADGVVWFEFDEICGGPRSQNDYIELARCYQTVIVSEVPVLDETKENEARRFIALVDEFYDRRVKLMLSAAEPLDTLYQGNRLGFEFQRTRSRLEEMQSHDYLAARHIA